MGIQRVGDVNTAGGVAVSGAATVRINGRAVVLPGVSVTPHPCCGQRRCPPVHCSAVTVGGRADIRAEGKPVIVTGDVDSCGHARAGGSETVR
jgi:uncharacterized Zn-binding protein involved in type VI secretion